ncbi:MAG: glucokinase [Acidobacteria bacterium]|nr:glucokinase [Acidobacteriota bacterium]
MILAGDVGGTTTRLGLFDDSGGAVRPIEFQVFSSRNYPALEKIVEEFLDRSPRRLSWACFGVAGPVRRGQVHAPNLPWVVEWKNIAERLGTEKFVLINDLEATACQVAALTPQDALLCLNRGEQTPGNRAVIAAGTGLGEAFLYWDGRNHLPAACEGGHTDFGPRTNLEVKLLENLLAKFGHVSYERLLSGPGLLNIYEFLRETGKAPEPDWLRRRIGQGDPAAEIARAALDAASDLAVAALDLFVSIYGAEAGNLALKTMALGGLYIGGGIAPKIQDKLAGGAFMEAFCDKGRFREFMQSIPVSVLLDEKTALRGAARRAWIEKQREEQGV